MGDEARGGADAVTGEEPEDRYLRLSTLQWRRRAATGEGLQPLRKAGPARALTDAVDPVVPGEDRVLRQAISSDRKDRYGDVVRQGDAMDVSEYHGVVCWGHDTGGSCSGPPMLPIGKNLRFEQTSINGYQVTLAYCRFAGADELHPFAESCYRMARAGFIPDRSIGFSPKPEGYILHPGDEQNPNAFWYEFTDYDLLEYSLVPVGANTDAVQLAAQAKKAGVDLSPVAQWAAETLELVRSGEGLWVPRETLEAVWKHCGGSRELKLFDLGPVEARREISVAVRSLGAGRSPVIARAAEPGTPRILPAEPAADEARAIAAAAAPAETRTVIPYKQTPLADAGEPWDGPSEVAAAAVDDLMVMCCWYDEDGSRKSDFKLPHHRAAGQHACVRKGVHAAAQRLAATDIPDAAKAEIQKHLGRHYHEFNETPPWERTGDGDAVTRAVEEAAAEAGLEVGAVAARLAEIAVRELRETAPGEPSAQAVPEMPETPGCPKPEPPDLPASEPDAEPDDDELVIELDAESESGAEQVDVSDEDIRALLMNLEQRIVNVNVPPPPAGSAGR